MMIWWRLRRAWNALLLVLSGLWLCVVAPAMAGQTISSDDAIVYVPAGLVQNHKYPVLFTFSPGADAGGMVRFWQEMADTHHWIIYASKEYQNYIDMNALYPVVHKRMLRTLAQYPAADPSRVILTGMSGGGSFSHAMNLTYPGSASALIVNTGRIWEDVYARSANRKIDFGQSRRLVVFLASPTDFRYEEMKRDKQLMESLGWKVKWIEFPGGHRYAPESVYAQALQWIQSQPEWQ